MLRDLCGTMFLVFVCNCSPKTNSPLSALSISSTQHLSHALSAGPWNRNVLLSVTWVDNRQQLLSPSHDRLYQLFIINQRHVTLISFSICTHYGRHARSRLEFTPPSFKTPRFIASSIGLSLRTSSLTHQSATCIINQSAMHFYNTLYACRCLAAAAAAAACHIVGHMPNDRNRTPCFSWSEAYLIQHSVIIALCINRFNWLFRHFWFHFLFLTYLYFSFPSG